MLFNIYNSSNFALGYYNIDWLVFDRFFQRLFCQVRFYFFVLTRPKQQKGYIYYKLIGYDFPQVSLEYLIPAMLISAPATFAISKVMIPETRELDDEDDEETDNFLEEENK